MERGRTAAVTALVTLALGVAGCSGDYSQKDEDRRAPKVAGPKYDRPIAPEDSIFADTGLTMDSLLGGSDDAGAGALPVNKFLWQASLDTLSFLPLASTDPFAGVIATDWSTTPEAPGERFKVSVYHRSPALEASSVSVAVYREVRNEEGLWVPRPVDPETVRKLEDAILVRARQIRIAEIEGGSTG